MRRPTALAAVTLGILALAASGVVLALAVQRDDGAAPRLDWQAVTLPVPDGEPGRLVLRDATVCDGHWYIVGAVAQPDSATRPAAWTSTDGTAWTAMPLTPAAGSYYGPRSVLSSAACRESQLTVVGGKPGGAHGNPRISTWHHEPGADQVGGLVENSARFELYGGPKAVNVGHIAAGTSGLLMAGNRSSGAAVWTSQDAVEFQIVEGAPELASDDRGVTWAFDVAPGGDRWLAVGGIIPPGRIDRDPLGWTSGDGRTWRRLVAPASSAYEEMQRVRTVAGRSYAVGLRGEAFGAWRLEGDSWVERAVFGSTDEPGVPVVGSLAATGTRLLTTVSTGATHQLWSAADSGRRWRQVDLPAAVTAGPESALAVAAEDAIVLLVADDGQAGRAWISATAAE